jgi:hypothetical protein
VVLGEQYVEEHGLACNTVTTVAFRVWNDEQTGVVARLWKGSEFVDILLCYQCSEYAVAGKNVYGPLQFSKVTPYRPFENRAELVRLARQAFPDDKDIQALSETSR